MKKALRSGLVLLLALALLLSTGCEKGEKVEGEKAGKTASEEQTQDGEKTVIDAIGNEVKVPKEVNKTIVGCQFVPQEVSTLGGSDTIIAMLSQKHSEQIYKVFPHYKDVPDIGSFENINIEALLDMDPDIYFGGRSAPKANKKLIDMGVNVYTSWIGGATVETAKDEMRNVAAYYKNEDKAEELIQYWDDVEDTLDDKLGDIDEKDKKKVYYMSASDPLKTHNEKVWAHQLITEAGGINVAAGLEGGEASIEQILEWDPDVIFISKDGERPNAVEEFKANPQFETLTAIKNDQVFTCPTGMTWWWIPSPESPLGFIWGAKKLYPDLTKDINLKEETQKFYDQFYDYKLTDEEFESFF